MKPCDTSTPHCSTPAESVHTLLKQNPRYSKHINYNTLKDLFTDKKDRDLLYTLDKKDKDQNVVIIEEGSGRMGGCALLREVFMIVTCTSTRTNEQ